MYVCIVILRSIISLWHSNCLATRGIQRRTQRSTASSPYTRTHALVHFPGRDIAKTADRTFSTNWVSLWVANTHSVQLSTRNPLDALSALSLSRSLTQCWLRCPLGNHSRFQSRQSVSHSSFAADRLTYSMANTERQIEH